MAKSKLDYLQIKHLTGTQAEIAEVIGIEAYRKLVGYFGGERIAVAKPSTLINFAVARNIAEENNYSEEVMTALEMSKKEQEKIIAGLKLPGDAVYAQSSSSVTLSASASFLASVS